MSSLKRDDFRDLPPVPIHERRSRLHVTLLVPARELDQEVELTLKRAIHLFEEKFPGQFEIILIPNPAPHATEEKTRAVLATAEMLSKKFSQVKSVPHLSPPHTPGKGSALRTGFLASSGDIICFTDADLPYDLKFFDDAFRKIAQGYDLVTANRRRPESRFDIPVSVLHLAYSRHRLGLLFNRTVRFFFPIETTDTQAGIKAMSRRLAEKAFLLQLCPGFFFDIELFLVNRNLGWAHAEVPVTLYLNSEKSTVRVLRESVLALYWLARIWVGSTSGHYGRKPKSPEILKRYSVFPLGTYFFLTLRWILTPYSQMSKQLPRKGKLLDYGCGHGLFGLALAQESSERIVTGIDHDSRRIEVASKAGRGISTLNFTTGELFQGPQVRGISLIDVMHYFEPKTQEAHLRKAYDQLEPNGVLIFREVDPNGGIMSGWNRFYEKVATSIGFTQSNEEKLFFRSKEDWVELLTSIGFKARAERCSSILFADVLFIGEKTSDFGGQKESSHT